MKYLINDVGRECTCCGEFKQWDEYGNKKRSVSGKQPRCISCTKILRYIDVYGCLKEDNIDTNHRDADDIMNKYINRAYRVKHNLYKEIFKKERLIKRGRYDDLGRECNDCGRYKYWKFFNNAGRCDMPNRRRSYCKQCQNKNRAIDKRTPRQKYLYKIKVRKRRIKEAIKTNTVSHKGFVYAYWCEGLSSYKIGKTKQNPYDYIKVKSKDYGLKLVPFIYISSNIRDYDAEWLIASELSEYRIHHRKPCGGIARELFKCTEAQVLMAFSGVDSSGIMRD